MDLRARDEINLRVLQKIDPSTTEILKTSPYVVLYSYSTSEASWSKMPFEGTLFIYKTRPGLCAYRILNRLNLDSFQRDLCDAADVVETEGYVIHRQEEEIWGLWIWDGRDRRNIYDAMISAADMSCAARPDAPLQQKNENSAVQEQQDNPTAVSISVENLFAGSPAKRPWTPTTVVA